MKTANKKKKPFRNKAAGFYVGMVAGFLALAGLVFFAIAAANGRKMVTRDALPEAGVCILIGLVCELLAGMTKWEFIKLFSPVAYLSGVMFLVVNRMEYITSLAGKSGNYLQPSIVIAAVLMLLASVVALVSVFLRQQKQK